MKLKSASGYVAYVSDLEKTKTFYEDLGFNLTESSPEGLSFRLNWFWIDFHPYAIEADQDFVQTAKQEPKGGGLFFYFSVEDVDEAYEFVLSKGMKPETKPTNKPWGNREFILKDPDGFKLVFFKKK